MKKSTITVKKAKKELLAAVREAENTGVAATGTEWLCDNAVLLAGVLDGYLIYRKKHRAADTERVFAYCAGAVKKGLLPDKNSVCPCFEAFSPSVDECAAALPALKAAYAVRAIGERASESTVSFCVTSIRSLADISADEIFSASNEAEKVLCRDPAGIYPFMSPYTKTRYREAVKRLAKENGVTEKEAAREAVSKAQSAVNAEDNHVGFYLPLERDTSAAWVYIAAELVFSVGLCFFAARMLNSAAAFFLLTLPVYAFVRVLSGLITPALFPAKQLFSLDEEAEGVYLPGAVTAVSSLLPEARNAREEYEHFAALRSSDSSPDSVVVALYDLKNADSPVLSSDKADICAVKEVIDRLNLDFGGGFVMAVRDRVYSPGENEYTGHERKRGAFTALVRLLCDGENGFSVLYGDTERLRNKKYVLALDSDTELSFEAVHRLLCIACHPLNAARYDPEKRRITRGYGCIAPRTETSLASSCKTLFASVFTSGGAAAYSPAVSERYMDMFSVSLFTGKGLIDANAYLKVCADAFDDGRLLSHDIPEGALLRTAFAGNAVLTDSFPSSPASFFRRAERWIRGDIQNAPMIFRGTSASRSSARLPVVARFQLADNVRTAFTPFFCLLCVFASAFSGGATGTVLLLAGTLGVSGEGLVSCLKAILSGGVTSLMRTFFSSSVPQSLRALLRAAFMLGSLPQNASVGITASIRAVYRMLISKKHTLQWTTASAAEKQGGKDLVFSLFFPLLSAVTLIFLSRKTAFFGFAVLLFIPFSLSDGVKMKKNGSRLSTGEREILASYMSSMWDFFAENVNASENHLPPDNVQETPVRRTAHRTSPTNIGLYLVSALAAADMSFITADELFERINGTFSTLERLVRCRGLLYNWYDTKTLAPLKPLFVSTVDCGNLEVCLTALRGGLSEYARTDARFAALKVRTDALLASGDMTSLYNKKRGLFSIGLDASSDRLSDSFYDLFMSESVMTSYYHIARRDIPVSHWGRLGRPLVRAGRYTAAVSWTGTMFEYFMPSLFLPVYENSFRYEALKVCLREQKLFAGAKQPYGVSESGYYAFDPQLSYRYRANGIRRLALKRTADCGRIFSPYSAFLSLSADPSGAVKDLSKFASLHAFGRYGFYEAADFSSAQNAPQDYMLVRSYMAHHVGMSIIACANAVNGDIFVKRFMRDPDMRSADSLLHEKLPFDAVLSERVYKSREKKNTAALRAHGAPVSPECGAAVFSNGDDSLICDLNGGLRFIHSSVSVLGYSERSRGVFAGICTDGKTVSALTGIPGTLKDTCFYSRYESGGITAECAPALLNNHSALAVPVKVKNDGTAPARVSLLYCFEPELLPNFSPSEHPSFDSLKVRSGFDGRMNALTFERTGNGAVRSAFAAGFYDGSAFLFGCDREKIFGRTLYREHPFANGLPELTNGVCCLYPCGAIRLDTEIKPGKKTEKVLLIAAAETKERALAALARIRLSSLPDVRNAAPRLIKYPVLSAASPEEFAAAVCFGAQTEEKKKAVSENRLPVSALWRAGISGDLPLITVFYDSLPQSAVTAFIRLHNALNRTGSPNDLVFAACARSDYRNSVPESLAECIRSETGELVTGGRGGIHVVDTAEYGESFSVLLKAVSGIFFPHVTEEKTAVKYPAKERVHMSCPAGSAENCFVPNGYHIGTKGGRPWCHTLSNRSFGTLLSDSSLGYTWALNSRQNKLTPWSGDVCAEMSGERLYIKVGGVTYDAAAGADVTFYDDKAVYTCVCGGVGVRVTVQTDARAMKKRVTVKLTEELRGKVTAAFSVMPQLAQSERLSRYVFRIPEKDCLVLCNPANTDFCGCAGFYADSETEITEENGVYEISAKLSADHTEVSFFTVFSRSLRGVRGLMELPFREPLPERVRFTSFSPELNAFGSALLLHNVFDTHFSARAGFYQCSGAYGFRDQLQDAGAFAEQYPQTAKRQILRCCAAQFPEGDVLHWFHVVPFPAPCFKGVRTHCSDDLLWLPLAVSDYIKSSDDTSLLSLPVPFLAGEPLMPDERERYGGYKRSGEYASVYEHCVRAIKHSLRFGAHSLPLIGSGDWNDSFSEVGTAFKGESVWLAEFLRLVCLRFMPVCELVNDGETELLLRKTADDMKNAVLKYGHNGKYFIRGYYDDGRKLGDENSTACKIDLLPQAFAVFADIGDRKMQTEALSRAFKTLFDSGSGTLKLFAPPFDGGTERAGYVNDYPRGVRENGGQYTHAAVWFALALKRAGFTAEAVKLCETLCPAKRYTDEKTAAAFMNEPYAMTGDICTEGALNGRGGWSLYTGSAGWYLRLLREIQN